jgi:putative transposase
MQRKVETLSFYRKRLPHWTVRDGLYFVTIRQKDSIPANAAKIIRSKTLELDNYAPSEQVLLRKKIFAEMDNWLDRNTNKGNLADSEISRILIDSIQFRRDSNDWDMIEFVIMPNHIHLFFGLKDKSLKTVISNFKRWTSKEIKPLLKADRPLWHREWFDHWSRSGQQDEKIVKYIRQNPVKAGLVKDYKDWPLGSWAT